MLTFSIIVAIASLALFIWAVIKDIRITSYYPLYNKGEKNEIHRGSDGYYAHRKGMVITVLVTIAASIPAYWFGWWWITGLFAPVGIAIWVIVDKNARTQKQQKEEQFKILRILRRDPEWRDVSPAKPFKNKWVWGTFYDFAVDAATGAEAREWIFRRLAILAQKPESHWWSLDRNEV